MENPNTRPYTAEELEALFKEEASNSDMPENNKGGKANPDTVILHNNIATPMVGIPAETFDLTIEPTEKQQTTSKFKAYAPFIILGVILTGVGIYLYYDYRKSKEAEKMQKPENE